MPAVLSYPGVYIEEVSSGVHTIAGVATSITAFVGRAQRGAVDDPIRVQSFGEFERQFGGLWTDSALGHTVSQFFQNGGGDALIVRVYHAPSAAQTTAGANADGIAALDPAAAAAQGTLTLDTNPASGETMTIDTKIYTFDPAAVFNYARNSAGMDYWLINEHNHLIQDALQTQGQLSEANVKARACLAREGHATSVCGAQKRSGRGSAPVRAPPALR